MHDRDVLQEQIDYYRARAPEYDEWFERSGMYDMGEEWNRQWNADVAEVEASLDRFAPTGRVLELACGTGWWTERLARYASSLTCLDASIETIDIARVRAPNARFVVADIFDWEPEDRYDVVFFSFWVSHVPASRFGSFWSMVERALVPGGRVFLMDNRKNPPKAAPSVRKFYQQDTKSDGVVVRTLNDGREFRAVKIYYAPDELTARLSSLGWSFEIHETPMAFYYGWGSRG